MTRFPRRHLSEGRRGTGLSSVIATVLYSSSHSKAKTRRWVSASSMSRSIYIDEQEKAVPGLVRAGRPRSREAIIVRAGRPRSREAFIP